MFPLAPIPLQAPSESSPGGVVVVRGLAGRVTKEAHRVGRGDVPQGGAAA